MNDHLYAAYGFAERGWQVFPLLPRSKKPYGGTNGLKDATTDKAKIRHLWGQTPDANIGIRTGRESRLIVLDIDKGQIGRNSMQALQGAHSEPCNHTLNVKTGGDGIHAYFTHPGGNWKVKSVANAFGDEYPSVDVRGDGGYVVAPPSIHETGALYEFGCAPGTPLAEPPTWLLSTVATVTETVEDISLVSALSDVSVTTLEDAIRLTLPTEVGQRHHCIFAYARALKGVPEYRDKKATELKVPFKRWFNSAPVMLCDPVYPFECAHEDFIEGWGKVLYPAGVNPLKDVLTRAMNTPEPPECDRVESDEAKLLVKICREFQRDAGASPFYLSCRVAKDMLGLAHNMLTYRLFKALVREGIIKEAKPGTKRKATRWRYLIPIEAG